MGSVTYSEPFSYVDSALGFAYFNLTPELDQEILQEIGTSLRYRESDREYFTRSLSKIGYNILFTQFRSLFFHEWHHCLQQIFYPYSYLQSWRELYIALRLYPQLKKSSQPFELGHIGFPKEWSDTIAYSSMIYGLDILPGNRLQSVTRDISDLKITDITLIDLLEDATSIFQFKVEQGCEGNGSVYTQWINRKGSRAYSNVFRLLSRLMGEDDAYVALPPLVQTSFSTTWPTTCFVNLVNFTLDTNTPVSQLGCDTYYSILDPARRFDGNLSHTFPDPKGPTKEDEFFFFSNEQYSKIVEMTPKHTAYPLASRYIEMVKTNPDIEKFLFHPYRSNVQDLLAEEFLPAVTILRINNKMLRPRDTLLIINPKLTGMSTPLDKQITYSQYLPEILKRKDVAYSLITNINESLEHNCHHKNCPYFPTNVCRRWTAIPKDFKECAFPDWFKNVTGRNIDLNTRQLKV